MILFLYANNYTKVIKNLQKIVPENQIYQQGAVNNIL